MQQNKETINISRDLFDAIIKENKQKREEIIKEVEQALIKDLYNKLDMYQSQTNSYFKIIRELTEKVITLRQELIKLKEEEPLVFPKVIDLMNEQLQTTHEDESQVYIMENELGLVKIGYSNNPEKRKKTIKNNSGLKITRQYNSEPCSNYKIIEKALHKKFKEFRKEGEWFNIKFENAAITLREELNKQHTEDLYWGLMATKDK